VRVELAILDGDDRVDHVLRNLAEWDERAVLYVELADHRLVLGEYLRFERRLD
jgi:hypothetical protein